MKSETIYQRPAGGKIIADVVAAHPGKGHPRILFTNDSFGLFQVGINSEPWLNSRWKRLEENAQVLLDQPPVPYRKERHRLLRACQQAGEHILTLAIAYHVTGKQRYAQRLWQELEQVCTQWPDWNPYHFLDTGEMAMAVAVAYDWLYDNWDAEQKRILETALMERALKPILEDYLDLPRERASGMSPGWLGYRNNWSLVCSGGCMMAALAICDQNPAYLERCALVLGMGIQEVEGVLATYAPDGGCIEGPAYWGYAARFLAYLASSLQSAAGSDYGLLKTPGLSATGGFPVAMLGPGGMFNFSDAAPSDRLPPELLWYAKQFQKPEWAALYRSQKPAEDGETLIRELLFSGPQCPADLETDHYFRRVETVTLRDSWDMEKGYFIGFHAGENGVPHYHMDCGTFVFDMNGRRFACDLGAGTYNEAGLWHRYRYSAQGHNTWVINPDGRDSQDPKAKTTITNHKFGESSSYAIADISDAYADVKNLKRGILATEGKRVFLIQDEIETLFPSEAYWQMHTAADIEILPGGKQAVLTSGEDGVLVSLLTENEAVFQVHRAWPYDGTPYYPVSDSDEKTPKLILHFTDLTVTRVAVEFRYFRLGEPVPTGHLRVKPLAAWDE